jgi:expansin (peptidoglycan-binding protein)
VVAGPVDSIVQWKEMKYVKYHGLGNDYLVIRPTDVVGNLEASQIQRICDRNYGVGSDGILLGPLDSDTNDFRLTPADSCLGTRHVAMHGTFQRELDRIPDRSPRIRT